MREPIEARTLKFKELTVWALYDGEGPPEPAEQVIDFTEDGGEPFAKLAWRFEEVQSEQESEPEPGRPELQVCPP